MSAQRKKKVSPGFTLVELLVVITIITLLITVGIIAFSRLTQNSRDARRKADLGLIQSALEQYHADLQNYPVTGNVGLGTTSPLTGPNGRTYIGNLPLDPNGGLQYSYQALPSTPCTNTSPATQCSRYCLVANMENATNIRDLPECTFTGYINPYEVSSP